MALTDLTRISTSGIATGTSLSGAILHGDAHFRGTQVGVTSALFDSSDDALEFGDNVKLRFGASNDLSLFHNASDSVISHSAAGEGSLKILSGGAQSIECIKAGAVELAHNGNKKLETDQAGVKITGILTATEFSGQIRNPSGISTFYDLRVTNNLTVEGTTSTLDTTLIGVDRVEVGANSNSIVGVAVTQSGTADLVNLFDGATKVVTVDDVGNVGLGSAIPRSKLDVSGNIYGDKLYGSAAVYANGHPEPSLYLTSTTTTGSTRIFFGDSSSALAGRIIYQNNGDYFQIFTAFGERVRIDANGYVGIGITNPDSPLEVVHDGPSIATLHHSDGGTNDEARIMLGALANNPPDNRGAGIAAINMGSGHDLSVKTSPTHSASPTEKLRIKNDGQILHGTTAHGGPYDGLTPAFISEQVNDYHAFTLAVNSTNAGHSGILQFVRSRGNADGANTIVNNGDRVASIYGIVADGTDRNSSVAAIDYRVDGVVGVNSTPGRIEFRLTPSNGNVPVERVRINALGYMGVGAAAASNPQTSLHIQDSTGATGTAQLKISKGSGAAGAPDAISRANNYIHLGGSEWRGTGDGYYMIGFGYTNDNVGTGMPAYVGYRETSNSGYTQGDLIFGTRSNTTGTNNPDERLRIKSDGEVLLGTGGVDRPIAAQRFNSGNGWGGTLQIEKPNPSSANNNVPIVAITAFNGANEQYTGGISFNRSNSNTQGTQGAVNVNQQLGNIAFNGSDGTNFIQGAEIFAIPDQTFATNDGPASLVFATTPDGTSEDEPQEHLRIYSDGEIKHSFTSNNSTVAEGLFINNLNNGTGNNASLIFSCDSGERKKASISYIDTGNYGTGDMAFCLDNLADSGELHVTDHERMRITKEGIIQTGLKEITGGNNLAIQSFVVKGKWTGAPSIGKEIELLSGYDSAVKMVAIGYNLTDIAGGGTYGGDLVFHTQPLYSNPTTPIPERMRILSSGEVKLTRGGISAQPSLDIYGSGNASDVLADNLRIHNWGNSDGDYWDIGVNHGLDANGNNTKPSNTLRGAGIRINGKNGSVTLITSPSSTSTQYEGLVIDRNGVVSTPLQPAFRAYTTADKTNNGDFGGDSASPNNSSWSSSNNSFYSWDNNDDFDHTDGRFTAPVDGKYHFTCVWDAKAVQSMIDMKINSTYAIRYEPTGRTDNSWETHSWSCSVSMGAGDYAILEGRGASGSYPFHMGSGHWGFWTGHKIT